MSAEERSTQKSETAELHKQAIVVKRSPTSDGFLTSSREFCDEQQRGDDQYEYFTLSRDDDEKSEEITKAQATVLLASVHDVGKVFSTQITADADRAVEAIRKSHYQEKEFVEAVIKRISASLRTQACSTKAGYAESTSGVDGIVSTNDDPCTPVSTFRAWTIGLFFSIIGAGINIFFAERLPGIGLSSYVAQLLAYPLGKLMEKTLPSKPFSVLSRSYTLNPGPFNAKEHMLITIMANVSFGSAYATSVIIAQRLPAFYNQAWAANWGYQILLVLSTQILGYGLAGISRSSLVYPATSVWPGTLAVIALNKSFHDGANQSANGWRISRLRWFNWVFLASFLYFFLPNFLITSLSQLNWITWLAPKNAVLAAITGSYTGLGINPFPTLDYNIVSAIVDPIVTPFSAVLNIFAGMTFMGVLLVPAIWFSNTWFTSHLPINSNQSFDNQAMRYNISRILTSSSQLNITAYEDYSPVYISATNVMVFAGHFALYPAVLIYAYLYHGTEIAAAFKGIFKRANEEKKDIHMTLMEAYDEVPGWWYLLIMLVGVVMAFTMIGLFPTGMPIWGVFFAISIGLVFIIPIGLIVAVSNVEVAVNVLAEMVAGFAIPRNPVALMIFKTYGTTTLAQGLSFAGDLKLGHYCKIPPKIMFSAQLVATILSAFITLGVTNWQINNIEGFCLPNQKQKFICPSANTCFTSSVLWGVIGPRENYGPGGLYSYVLFAFLVGTFVPITIYFAAKRWPNTFIKHLHAPIIFAGVTLWAPLNLSYLLAALPMGWFFNIYLKRRAYAWWSKYNFITATGLSSGIAVAGLFAFIVLQYPGFELSWIGNTISTAGCDASGCALRPLAVGQHFGPGSGEFKYHSI